MDQINNLNIASQALLPTPAEIRAQLPADAKAQRTVIEGRQTLRDILDHQDPRKFLIIGPCSIHDLDAALEYAARLHTLARRVENRFFMIMRVYFEKPRTSTGWKGFINDPRMDDSFHIEEGLVKARQLLLKLAGLGIAAGTEALDPIMPQYLSDLITWTAIGARTTESQTHRELASGLSTPVGFKNGTDGNIAVAVNAMKSSASPHSFLGINSSGQSAVIRTRGNQYGHLVLRGGADKPNYDSVSVALCEEALKQAGLSGSIVIDCSHANSFKKPELQPLVMENCVNQLVEGNRSIVGMMIESNLHAGNQAIPEDLGQLKYGISVTDACIDWDTTEQVVLAAHKKLV